MIMENTNIKQRVVETLFPAKAMPEGAGVTVHRSIGRRGLMNLDPFLLLDEMDIDETAENAGFPDHPHRGFETVTYMLSGEMAHKDSSGNQGVIGPGDVQWMTAGRGVVHSEMPVSKGTKVRGFQLWVNLPSSKKMIEPRYQDVSKGEIPTVHGDGFEAKLIAGQLEGIRGPVTEIAVNPFYADITLTDERRSAVFPIASGHTAFIYTIDSDLTIADQTVENRTLAILSDGDEVSVSGQAGSRFILIAGQPLGEPVARYGPFVMNTQKEILATLDDWKQGRFLSER